MYMNRILEVGRAANGFIVECSVPLKRDKKSDDMEISCCGPSGEAQYLAKDEAEVAALVAKLLPLLSETFSSKDSFNDAFEKATK